MRSPVTAQRRSYASVTSTRKAPCPRRARDEVGVAAHAVFRAERLPGERGGQAGVAHEKPAPGDDVVGGMELEEKWLTGADRPKRTSAGPPEVDFVGRVRGELGEPVAIG